MHCTIIVKYPGMFSHLRDAPYILQLQSPETTRIRSFRFSDKMPLFYMVSRFHIFTKSLQIPILFPGKLYRFLFLSLYHTHKGFILFLSLLRFPFSSSKRKLSLRIISDVSFCKLEIQLSLSLHFCNDMFVFLQ